MDAGTAEVARKAAVLWVAPPGGRPVAAWQLWRDGASYLLTGPGEQPLPGLAGAATCTVTARADGGGAVSWTAEVAALDPAGAEWAEVFPALAAARLNGTPREAGAAVYRLTPVAG